MTKKTLTRLPSIACPHCGARSVVRSSEPATTTVRDLRMYCSDIECGHVFAAQLSVTHTIRPSAKPNEDVRLPFGNPNLRGGRPLPANDDTGLPANDDRPAAAETTAVTT